jgi:nicotinamidase/pyrazinamidase
MTTLLLIDIQNDFHPGGSLAIPSADSDAERTASFIKRNALSIDRIVATLDSHHKLHIAHPCFWTDANGDHPAPFTLISSRDVIDGKWIPRSDLKCPPIDMPLMQQDVIGDSVNLFKENGDVDTLAWGIEYTKRLEEKGRFQLCIWPEHCLIGTPGHNVVKCVRDAMDEWSDATGKSVEWIEKGQNLLTEMYSALCAEVPVNAKTSFNTRLLDSVSFSELDVFVL